jgi:hypothetical protein
MRLSTLAAWAPVLAVPAVLLFALIGGAGLALLDTEAQDGDDLATGAEAGGSAELRPALAHHAERIRRANMTALATGRTATLDQCRFAGEAVAHLGARLAAQGLEPTVALIHMTRKSKFKELAGFGSLAAPLRSHLELEGADVFSVDLVVAAALEVYECDQEVIGFTLGGHHYALIVAGRESIPDAALLDVSLTTMLIAEQYAYGGNQPDSLVG